MSARRGFVPPGFASLDDGGRVLIVDEKLADGVREAGLLDPERLERRLAEARGERGRAATAEVTLPGERKRLVVRGFRRGGLLGPLLGNRLPGPARVLRELRVTAALCAARAPVPRPVLAIAWRANGGLFWSGAFATVRVPGAVDALAFLASRPDARRLREAARAAGRAVRRFHDAGGCHADLHVKNLLLRQGSRGIEAVVIDLDRGRRAPRVLPSERMTELMRLYRSLRKRGVLEQVGPRGCAAFFRAYWAGHRPLRLAMLRRLPRERLRVALHALRYRRAG